MRPTFFAPAFLFCFLVGTGGDLNDVLISLPINFIVKSRIIFRDVAELWNFILQEPETNLKEFFVRGKEHKILRSILEISSKISGLEKKMTDTKDVTIEAMFHAFPDMLKLEISLHELSSILSQINFAEEQLREYLILGYRNDSFTREPTTENPFLTKRAQETTTETNPVMDMSKIIMKRHVDSHWLLEKFTLEDFATWATGHTQNSIRPLLNRINDLVVSDGSHMGLFDLLVKISQEMQNNVCNLKQSPHQVLYNLYNTITVAELKGNTILQFSYMLLKMYSKGNFTVEAKIARSNYERMSKEKMRVAKRTLLEADRTIYNCDPKQHVEGVTYTKLTRLLQAYIENEVNLNPYGTCRENCMYYTYTEYHGCFKNQFCDHQPPCRGKVLKCRYVDSDMDICTSTNSERRYDWVEYENGKILGNKGVCQKRNKFKVDSWWRYLFWHCSYCLCLCDDPGLGSERHFNLRDVTSDIEDNKIVTGVRILKNNKIIHLQIQQGILNPLGVVDKTSIIWKPVENYTINDDHVRDGIDYHTMTWLERAIDTDDLSGPPEHVVTGVRFRKVGGHLNLEVRVTPINFTTGKLFRHEDSYWLSNDNTDANLQNPRTEILLVDPDIPLRRGPHYLNSKHDQYIQFQETSLDSDAGQSTVPFIDSQKLTSMGLPLSGVGLIHRGKPGSGGFIAPKLITYDFTPHIKDA